MGKVGIMPYQGSVGHCDEDEICQMLKRLGHGLCDAGVEVEQELQFNSSL